MRMKDTESPHKVSEDEQKEQVLREEDPFHSWILFFLTTSTQLKNPRLSIYARILGKLKHRASAAVPCMAIASMAGRYALLYNETWTRHATYLEFVATLAHEAMHIILRHIPRSKRRMAAIPPEQRAHAHHIMNVAMDVVVNKLLEAHFPHMKHGVSGPWLLPEPLGLPPDADFLTQFEIMWSYQHALMQRAKEIVEEREKKREQEDADNGGGGGEGDGGPEPDPDAQTPGDEGGDKQPGKGTGTPQSGQGQGDQTSEEAQGPGHMSDAPGQEPTKGPGNIASDHFEAQAQAVADLMEAKAHQWHIKLDENGEIGSDEVDLTDFSGMDADELEAGATLLEEEGKHLVASAIRQHQKSRGTVPHELRVALQAILEEASIPWKTLLKNLVAARLLSSKRSTMDRPNKRRHILFYVDEETEEIRRFEQPLPQYPGSRRNKTYVCLFAVDTSGSMSNADVIEGLSEMQGLLKDYDDAHLIVVQCDTRISSVDIVGPDMDVEEYVKTIGRTSYGGTTFDAPFQLAQFMLGEGAPPRLPRRKETLRKLADYKHVDVIIYHTDGYAPTPSAGVRPSCPTIWLCTRNASTQYLTFGHVITRD